MEMAVNSVTTYGTSGLVVVIESVCGTEDKTSVFPKEEMVQDIVAPLFATFAVPDTKPAETTLLLYLVFLVLLVVMVTAAQAQPAKDVRGKKTEKGARMQSHVEDLLGHAHRLSAAMETVHQCILMNAVHLNKANSVTCYGTCGPVVVTESVCGTQEKTSVFPKEDMAANSVT